MTRRATALAAEELWPMKAECAAAEPDQSGPLAAGQGSVALAAGQAAAAEARAVAQERPAAAAGSACCLHCWPRCQCPAVDCCWPGRKWWR